MGSDRRAEVEARPEREERQEDEILCEAVPEGFVLTGNAAGGKLFMRAEETGRDWTVIVTGGAAPHIGCAVLAVPRESLRGDGKRSSTASVLNVTGHKDEEICRYVAERMAAATGRTVVCTGGVHIDGITQDQIDRIRSVAVEMTARLIGTAAQRQEKNVKKEKTEGKK